MVIICINNTVLHFSCIRVLADNLHYGLRVFYFQILDFHILFYHVLLFSTSVFYDFKLLKVMSLSPNVILQSKDHLFFSFSHDYTTQNRPQGSDLTFGNTRIMRFSYSK